MTAAAFRATIHGLRTVPSRGVLQVTIEAPIEQLQHIASIAEHGKWVAVARITEAAAATAVDLDPADKPKKSPAQIAGYLCTLQGFAKFLRDKFTNAWLEADARLTFATEADVAAETVRILCDVDSRADITEHSTEWLSLMLAYKLWDKEAEVVPA